MKLSNKQIKLLEIFFKALANKKRIKILILVNQKPLLNVEEISKIMHIRYQTVATHIQHLEQVGFIYKKYSAKGVEHKITERGEKILKYFTHLLNS